MKQISDKQLKYNAEFKAVSIEIRNAFNSCQCCNKYDDRTGSFCHEIAHIIGRRVKQYFSDRRNLLLLCKDCHKALDSYKSYVIYNHNKELFEYIITWLNSCNEQVKKNKLIDSLDDYLNEQNSTYDPREFNSDGNEKRTIKQNDGYWIAVIGQYIYWYKIKYKAGYMEDSQISEYIHAILKQNVLPDFSVTSTTQLNTKNMPDYVKSCYIYFGEKMDIDIFEFGEKPKK